jgi:2,4-dienoyl-CoA reductase-like NADH-dependent reductase (Old Yellow Enzyme family)/thioredoxin reductase
MSASPLVRALEPISFGTISLKHRLVVPPHGGGTGSLVKDDAAYESYVAYWMQRIDDGFQWVGGGPGYVRSGLNTGFEVTGVGAAGGTTGLFRMPRYRERFSAFTEGVHAAGGFANVQLVLQGGMPLAPSSAFAGYNDHRATHVMSAEEIASQIEEYVESALIAIDCGADSIEIKGCHDDLVQWFLSPLTNRRTDGWGGSYENRRRFMREIVEGIRSRTPRPVTVGLRLAFEEQMEGGWELDECIRVAKSFEEEGTVDYISADMGHNWGAVSYVQPGMYAEGEWADHSERLKREISLPVLYVGRVVHAETAERIIATGQADMVGMARALMAEPKWLTKATTGRTREMRPCIGVNDCIHRYTVDGIGFGCGVNPAAGRETAPPPAPTTEPLSILVVGGGPGGMTFAELTAARGHDVRLWEQREELGGALRIAARADVNNVFLSWIDYQTGRLEDLGVGVELGRTATVDSALGAGADVVVVASGARPRLPGIAGEGLPHVATFVDAITGTAALGKRVAMVVEDDFLAPLTTADHLSGLGHEVTFIHQTPGPGPLVGKYSAGAWYARLDAKGVRYEPQARVVEIRADGLTLENTYSGRRYDLTGFDSVVLACGGTGVDDVYVGLRGRHPRVHVLGDAFAPRRLTFATRQAYELALLMD